MSKMMKLCVMHTVIVMVLLCATLVAKFIIVDPLRENFLDANMQIASLEKENKELESKLAGAKAVLINDMRLDDIKLVRKYISNNTDNLTGQMIDNAAKAIVEAAWENKIPLDLAVGISQAIAEFNTTYKTKDRRGILAVPAWFMKNSKHDGLYFNTAKNGADAGCEALDRMLDVYKDRPIYYAVRRYLFEGNIDTNKINEVFIHASNFNNFRYKAYRKHLDSLPKTTPDSTEG